MRLGVLQPPLIDIAAAAAFRALRAALRLGVFEELAKGRRDAGTLAREIGAEPGAVGALLALLEAAGHVRRVPGGYANSASTARWLIGPGSIGAFVRIWTEVAFDEWSDLESSVRSGGPATHMHDWLGARGHWPLFNAAMADLARAAADPVAAALPLDGAGSVIDLGGSHGLYAIALCRRHPALRATVFDLPVALERARENVAAAGVADRVTLAPGDMLGDEIAGPYDAALMFQLVHYFDDDRLLTLLRKVRAALRPGGFAAILDQLTVSPPSPAARAFLRALDLQYRVSLGGRLRTFDEVRRLSRDAGFAGVERKRLLKVPGNDLVIARRP